MQLRHRFRATAAPRWLDAVSNFGSALLRHARPRNKEPMTSVSRRLLVETLEPRVLLSADLIPVQGNIAVPGQVDRYTFTLAQEKQVLVESRTDNSSLTWDLIGPDGSEFSNQKFASPTTGAGPALDLVAGNYTLQIEGADKAATGTYQFRLVDIEPTYPTAVAGGAAVAGAPAADGANGSASPQTNNDAAASPLTTKSDSATSSTNASQTNAIASDVSTSLTQAQLEPVLQAAIARLDAAGLSPVQMDAISQIQVNISDLPVWTLGSTNNDGSITISRDGAGWDWFVDPAASGNAAFTSQDASGDLVADPTSDASTHIDLLTVLDHELEHALGVPHSENGLMSPTLSVGTRRLPSADQIASATGTPDAADLQITPTDTWIATAPGFWDVASNWSAGRVPGAGDDVLIPSTVQVGTQTVAVGTVTVRNAQAAHSLLSSNLSGLVVSGSLTLAASSEVDSSLTVSGSLTATGPLAIGGNGISGTLTVQSGATATLNAASTIDNLQMPNGLNGGGTLIANAAVTLAPGANSFWGGGLIDATGGSFTNDGLLSIQAAFSGPPLGDTVRGTFNNAGTIDLYGGNNSLLLQTNDLSHPTTITNLPGATFEIEGPAGIGTTTDGSAAKHYFQNQGTFAKIKATHSAGGTSTIALDGFSNSGTVDVQADQLSFGNQAPGGSFVNNVTVSSNGGTFQAEAGGVLNLSGNSTITYSGTFSGSGQGTIQLANGVLTVAPAGATFNFSPGLFQWTGGDINGGTLTNTGTMTLSGTNTKSLGVILNNSGTIEHTGGILQVDFSIGAAGFFGTINNTGLYDLQGDLSFNHAFADTAAFNNSGTFRKSAGTGTASTGTLPLNNLGGTIDVESGTLNISSGTHTGGTFITTTVAGVQTMLMFSGSHTFTGTYTGSGTGIVQLNGTSFTVGASGAVFNFPGGELQWKNGILDGGTVGLTNAGTMTLLDSGTSSSTFTAHNINNVGTFIQAGVSQMLLGTGTFTNLPGALYVFQGDGSLFDHHSGASAAFINLGTIRKASGTTTIIGPPGFDNAGGTIDVESGTITMRLGLLNGGSIMVAAGAMLDLADPVEVSTVNYKGTFTGSGQGTVRLAAGTLAVDPAGATFDLPAGMFQWTGGTISGGTLTNSGALTLSGTGSKFLGSVLNNVGTIDHVSGTLLLDFEVGANPAQVGTLNNSGLYDLQADVNVSRQFVDGATVNNTGTFRKSAGSSTGSTVGVNFNNTGTVEARSGTLSLSSVAQLPGQTLTGGTWNIFSNATLVLPNSITTNSGNITLDGVGSTLAAISGLGSNTGNFSLLDGRSFTTADGFTNSAAITLGAGSTLQVSGNFTQTAAGALTSDIGGSVASGQFGTLAITGSASLAGTFNAVLTGGFGPQLGNNYTVVSFGSETGAFATINGLKLVQFQLFSANLKPNSFELDTVSTTSDLATTAVNVVTPSVTPGQNATVSYTVANQGGFAATGDWYDSVYLTTDVRLTPTAVLLGRVHHVGDVAPLSSYSETLTAPLPALVGGSYHVIVLADSRGLIPDANRANNAAPSATTLQVTIPALQIGTPVTSTIANGQDIYYHLIVAPGADLTISPSFTAGGEAEVYLRYGAVPDRTNYDQTVANIFDQSPQLRLTNAQGGDYYILLHGRAGAGSGASFTLRADAAQLSIDHFTPTAATNTSVTTISVFGTKFTANSTLVLVGGDGIEHAPVSQSFIDSTALQGDFDLSALPVGNYSVRVHDGLQVATASTEFDLSTSVVGGSLLPHLSVPDKVIVGAQVPVSISFVNNSNETAVVPLVQITATNVVRDDQTIQLVDPSAALLVAPNSTMSVGASIMPSPDSPGTQVSVQTGVANPAQIMGWGSLKDSFRPGSISPAAWDAIWQNLTAALGNTLGDLYSLSLRDASALATVGAQLTTTSDAINFEAMKANDQFPSSVLTMASDIGLPGSGVPLTFARSFASTIVGRYDVGRLGAGWVDDWDYSVATNSNGVVIVREGPTTRAFGPGPNGLVGQPGDPGVLTLVNGAYQLRDPGGVLTVFNTDGSLSYIQDANNNRVTAGDANGLMTSLTASNGQSLTFTYNAQGRISQIADSTGRTVTYTYDASGQHLTSVSSAAGTIQYTYTSETSGPRANEIASITNPDGTHAFFTYDSQGRLSAVQSDNGAGALTYSYGTANYRITDAHGNATTYYFNDTGAVQRVQDPLGNVSSAALDSQGRATSIASLGGGAISFNYSQANQIVTTDPLGLQQTNMYAPDSGRLTSWTDANGNTTTLGYDSSGRGASTTFADGSTVRASYDASGNLVQTVNQAGGVFSYTYDSRGLVTKVQAPDGSQTTYTYDAQGNMTSATNAAGTISMTYDAAGRLTKIAYPNGKSLSFSYDAGGRRSQSVDQSGFTVNYSYDAAGRLAMETDGTNNLIVKYTYDNGTDALIRKDEGNGAYTTYQYDADGQVQHVVNYAPGGAVNSHFDYVYDLLGRVTSITTLDGTTVYGYDGDSRLTSAVLPNGRTITYSYDAVGNRQVVTDNGVSTSYTTNNLNQYVAINGVAQSYDAEGNLGANRIRAPTPRTPMMRLAGSWA
jgi:YD repeat-containing protein